MLLFSLISMETVVNCFKKRPDAVARLICFPWAGGGSIHYARWGNVLSSSVEGEVPRNGKEMWWSEPCMVLIPKIHNMEPVHIFLSGASAPYSETRIKTPKRSDLSDEDFLKWLISIGGTPPELLANPEVLKLFLPALKADLHVVENYRCNKASSPLFSCPVTCFDGKDDIPHDLQAWKDITSGDFTIKMFHGSHFYLKDSGNEKIILDYVTKHLETSEMDYL
uniref:oleoyl-[acyl-carrier-protein] hydrolase n=1 Tax=Neolamprologus brichardi TaxID=32507 RepID=A0A3Q4HIB6_NEOBR